RLDHLADVAAGGDPHVGHAPDVGRRGIAGDEALDQLAADERRGVGMGGQRIDGPGQALAAIIALVDHDAVEDGLRLVVVVLGVALHRLVGLVVLVVEPAHALVGPAGEHAGHAGDHALVVG